MAKCGGRLGERPVPGDQGAGGAAGKSSTGRRRPVRVSAARGGGFGAESTPLAPAASARERAPSGAVRAVRRVPAVLFSTAFSHPPRETDTAREASPPMWNGQSVSVILPTYNEKDSIARCIREFLATGVVDEVVVINNNAAPGTSEEVATTPAREVHESRQGYGNAIQRGFREARGDLILVCEPDGTFAGKDVFKLLAYADDFDVVYGTRTTEEFIWTGANMGLFLKWGNYAVAKMMEFLFNTVCLTDVGCTYRLIKRPMLAEIEPHFTVGGSHFGPEMMLITVIKKARIVQIPVNYHPRVGESAVTGDLVKAFFLGMRMIGMIVGFWLRHGAHRIVGKRLFPLVPEPVRQRP